MYKTIENQSKAQIQVVDTLADRMDKAYKEMTKAVYD